MRITKRYSSLLLKRIESQVCVCAQGAEDSLDFPEIMCNDSEQHFGSFSSSVPLKILLLVSWSGSLQTPTNAPSTLPILTIPSKTQWNVMVKYKVQDISSPDWKCLDIKIGRSAYDWMVARVARQGYTGPSWWPLSNGTCSSYVGSYRPLALHNKQFFT